MKHTLKLLKAWKDATDVEHEAGTVIELDADQAKELVFEGIAEKHVAAPAPAAPSATDIAGIVKSVVGEVVAAQVKAQPEHKIETHDKSDDDPVAGYLPEKIGDNYSKGQLERGLGLFAKDIYDAGVGAVGATKRLQKCQERSVKMLTKAAGDGMTVGTPSEGGFLVPESFNTLLLDTSLENAVVRPRATALTLERGNAVALPQCDNYDHSSNLTFGGLAAYWTGEEAQYTESKPVKESIRLELNKLTVLAYVTEELLAHSAVTIGSFLLPQMGATLGWKEDDAFINGTGAGMPLGLLNAPGEVSIAKETGQAAATVVIENTDKMFAQCRVRRPASTAWLYNKTDLFPQLAALKREVGTGGSTAGLLQTVQGVPGMSMYGYPLVDTEHCQAAGTVGDIILTDLSQYLIADDRTGMQMAQSIHLKFDYGQTAFKLTKFTDARPRHSKAFTRQNSTATESPIISIAVRA